MKNKVCLKFCIIIMIILTSIVSPSVWGQCQVPEKNTIINNTNQLNDNDFTWVKFCRGKISDIWEIGCGYAIIGYGFAAEDVICIINYRDKPLFQRFNEHEELAIQVGPWLRGDIYDYSIFANYGILPPEFIWLIYRIISFVNTV